MSSIRTLVSCVAAVVLLAAMGCQTSPYDAGVNADGDYDFASKKTWAFNKVREKVLDSENGKIVRAELTELLKARGLTQVAVDQADVWFSYDVGIFRASQLSWGEQSSLGEGRIIVRVIDPKTETEVWYGWVGARLKNKPDPERRIREALQALAAQRAEAPE